MAAGNHTNHLAYAVGALVIVGSTTVSAQTSADSQPEESGSLAEVVVTGSHVRGVNVAPVVNVQVLDRDQLQESGATQMADLVKQIPSNTGTTQYNENGALSGTAQFALRGLGFSSTLVLLNGRRAGVAPLSDKSGADFLDINQFPLALVQRIDVLKDGSSAIYGSEAVAGVVNIVTRKGFEGLELSADYASSTNRGYSLNLASGRRFDRGSLNVYGTYYHQTGNLRTDFPWLMERVGGNGIPGLSQLTNNNGFPGTYQRATTNAAGRPAAASGSRTVPDPDCEALGGVFPIDNAGIVNRATCNIDFSEQIGVIPAQDRLQAFVEAEFSLSDRLRYFNETSGSRNNNNVDETAPGFSNGAAVGGLISVPANAPFNFFIADPANANSIIAIEPDQWNPAVHQAVAVVGNFRPQGTYISGSKRQTNTYFRTLNGLEWSMGNEWTSELSHVFAYAEYDELNPLAVDATQLNNLIVTGKYNPFGTALVSPTLVSPKDLVSVAGNPQSVIDQIFYTSHATRRTDQNVVDLSASGPTLMLATGPLSTAVGVQYRRQTLNYSPDTLASAGLGTNAISDAAFAGSQNVLSGYAEAIVPVYDRASFQAAVRHEDYGGTSTTNPKLTGRLNLFSGSLALRGSWGTSFQAPTLTQNVTSQLLTIVNDPVRLTPAGLSCSPTSTGTGVTVVTQGGNLEPQNSRNYNLGVDFNPSTSIALTADLWRYDYRNLIASGQNAQSIVSGQCVNGVFVSDPRVTRNQSGLLSTVTTAFVNVGKVIAEGVDFSGTYTTSLGALGDLSLRADATYVDKFDAYGANGVVSHNVGSRNFNNNFAPMPRLRGTARARWSMGMHEVSLGANYAGTYRNDQDFNAPIDSFTTVDLQYALSFRSTTLAVGLNNAFDEDPPALTRYNSAGVPVTGPTAISRPGYDALSGANIQGRIVYARIKQSF